jgi:hypothetical protein
MLQEIPYGEYIDQEYIESKINLSKPFKSNQSNHLNQSNDLENLPISIEVVPHKAIIIHEVFPVQRNQETSEIPNYLKWIVISTCCVPILIILSSVRMG